MDSRYGTKRGIQINNELKGDYHQELSVSTMKELLLKSFFGLSLVYVRSLEGSQKAGCSVV